MIEGTTVLLDKMSGFDFEELVADILSKLGYGHVEKILYTQDGGRDILIHSSSGLIVIECKHQPKSSIGRPVVQKLHSAVVTSKATKGILVTTGRFTKEALEYASKLAGSTTPIDMVDRPILIDMASRANVILVSGKQKLSVWSYALPSKEETINAISSRVASFSFSHPRRPSELLNNLSRIVSYRPVYSITYSINSVFETSIGIIHRENTSKARILLDGNTGQSYADNVSAFLETEQQYAFNQPHEDFKGNLPTFKIDGSTMQRSAKKLIIEKHSRNVSYYGRNNRRYVKKCVPSERDIYISDIRQLYLPLTRLDFKLGSTSYYSEGAQAQSGRLLSLADNLTACRICNKRITEGAIICDTCGKVTHSGGFLIRSIHGFRCKRCGRTTCREHGFWKRRYLIFKEMLCPSCFEASGHESTTFRRFDPFNALSLWEKLFG
ncbi:MAG: restriction endonuclease [Candidatus Bathyarchaeota archaeon]|nr:restriction endonuclease [Candidatus Bathyarchaeota archaeon]